MHKKRLFWQLYPPLLVLALLALGLVAWYAASSLRKFYIDRTADDLTSRAWIAEEPFRHLLITGDGAKIDALCKRLGEQSGERITVILPDGRVVGDSQESPSRMENHADSTRPEVLDALAGEPRTTLRPSHTLHQMMRYAAVPVRHEGKIIGVVRTALELTAIEQAFSSVRLHVVTVSVLAAAILAAVGWILARHAARPLELLTQGAERFTHGDLTHRLPVADTLEVGALAETLNQMAVELDDKMRAVTRQRNEREAILSSMAEGVIAVDAGLRVIRFNQAAARLIGVDASRAEGRLLAEVVRNLDLSRLVDTVLATGTPDETDLVVHAAGQRFLHAHCTALHGAREGQVGALIVLYDVTNLRRLEKVRQDFVANVSHEFKTPVTAIQGFVETLLDGAMDDRGELERFLKIIATQSERLNSIIDDLLTLARIEHDNERHEIVLSRGPVAGVLASAVELCTAAAHERQIRIETVCPPLLEVDMNASLLEKAVTNLIDNAVKYSPPEATIHVAAAHEDGEVALRVRDHGCGIGREHLPRIFERFYRVDKARSRKLGGTGLGLAIVKHIAQSHGGRVTVESAPGEGSTFCIWLPAPSP